MKRTLFHRDDGADPKLPPLTVVIEEKAEKNERLSAAGPPVFDRVVYMEVTPTGQKSGVIYCPRRVLPDGTEKLDQQVIRRFHGVWQEWLRGATPSADGTPLEEWPLMDVGLVAALKAANVYTVQQLAGLSEGAFDNVKIPKVREWVARASAWLSEARDAAAQTRLQAELAKRDGEIETLKQQVEQLLSAQNGAATPGFDKRGRKKRAGREDDDILVELPPEMDEAADEEARV